MAIEILNDDETPMVFVVSVLEKQLGLDSSSAMSTMLKIHTTGGALISMQTREESERVASAIVSLARRIEVVILSHARQSHSRNSVSMKRAGCRRWHTASDGKFTSFSQWRVDAVRSISARP